MNTPQVAQEEIAAALREVIDPEVGVNVLDLGLIYEVLMSDEGYVQVTMTMTTPACPMGSYLTDNVRETLLGRLPQLKDVEVNLVWDPPWSPEMMSDEAKQRLGWSQG